MPDRRPLLASTTAVDGAVLFADLGAVAWLAEAALDQLWAAEQDEGCCPHCCAPCAALKILLDTGNLDRLVAQAPGITGSGWWITNHLGRSYVDREWLDRAWRMSGCHEQEADRG